MAEIVRVPAFHHQNRTFVTNVANMMVAAGSESGAQGQLALHLGVIWDHLEALGVGEDEIECDCYLFGRAAWQRYDELQSGLGAA